MSDILIKLLLSFVKNVTFGYIFPPLKMAYNEPNEESAIK